MEQTPTQRPPTRRAMWQSKHTWRDSANIPPHIKNHPLSRASVSSCRVPHFSRTLREMGITEMLLGDCGKASLIIHAVLNFP